MQSAQSHRDRFGQERFDTPAPRRPADMRTQVLTAMAFMVVLVLLALKLAFGF